METRQYRVFFKVSLSNGENIYENKGDYLRIPGELPPWERLKQYISDSNLTITSLDLYTDEGNTFNLPSSGQNPKFKAFADSLKPSSYNFFRRAGSDYGKGWEVYAVAEAIFSNYILQMWVNNNNPDNSWVLITGKA